MPPPARPLEGIRVLDVSDSIGAYCTKLLAGLGADVTKLEYPEGDELRRRPPFRDGASGSEASLVFTYYHADKRSITLDTRRTESLPDLEELGNTADVIVISPSRRRPLAGFDETSLAVSWARENAVVCAITPYGLTGPYRHRRATHFVAYATSGSMHKVGPEAGPPVTIPAQQHWDEASAHAAVCILAALQNRAAVGGQTIDISAHEVAVTRDFAFDRYDVMGMTQARTVVIGYPPTGTWQCKDGPFDVAAHQTRHWTAFLRMLDDPAELSDPSLEDVLVRREIFDGLAETIARLLANRNRGELVERGQAVGLPCSILNTPAEFIADEQLAARNYFVAVRGADDVGDVRMPGAPFKSSPQLFTVARGAPRLGEHNDDAPTSARSGSEASPVRAGVRTIDQLRVLTFGTFIAGNTTGLLLAELGADVVKIEAFARPEVLRNPAYSFTTTAVHEPSGIPNTPMYGGLSRSTRNLSLEMNTAEGRALFRQLVAVADVVIENFGAEAMRHWGCSFEELSAINPRLVMVSLSGYGRTGPRSSYLAYATNISNFSGLTATWQFQHGTHSDYIAAVHAVVGVLAAIAHTDRTGSGASVDVAQTEALAAVMAPIYLDPLNNGRYTPPTGNAVPGSLFTGAFQCQGFDRWIAIELEDLLDWSTLCDVLERPDLLVEDHAELDARRGELAEAITAWTAERSPHTAAQVLQNVGLAAGCVYDSEDIVRDPQLRERGASVEIDHPDLGVIEYYQSPHRMTKTPGYFRRRGPRLGEHTVEVLQEWLDLDGHAIKAFEDAKRGVAGAVRYPVGIVAVAFGGIGIEDAAQRAADLGFDHLDSSAGAIDRLDAAELAELAVPIGDRIAGFEVVSGCTSMAPFERRGEDRFEETVELFRRHPGARLEPGPRSAAAGVGKTEALVAALPGLRLTVDTGHIATWGEDPVPLLRHADHVQLRQAAEGRPQLHPDEGGDVDFAAVLAELERLDYPGLLSVEYFNLPDYGWPLDDPVGHAVALATHVRSLM